MVEKYANIFFFHFYYYIRMSFSVFSNYTFSVLFCLRRKRKYRKVFVVSIADNTIYYFFIHVGLFILYSDHAEKKI